MGCGLNSGKAALELVGKISGLITGDNNNNEVVIIIWGGNNNKGLKGRIHTWFVG